jgi:plastocyanin
MSDDGAMRPGRHSNLRSTVVIAVVVVVVVGVLASAAYAVERVRATSDAVFRPRRVSVSVGERVVWRSTGGTHTVTAYRGDWSKDSTISEGERTSFTFDDAGRYRYRCRIHSTLSDGRCSGMCGVVIVG